MSNGFNITGSQIVVSGSLILSDAYGNATGSLFGTASNAQTASYAVSASYAISSSHEIIHEVSSSYAESASYAQSSSYAITSSHAISASFVTASNLNGPFGTSSVVSASNALSASYLIPTPVRFFGNYNNTVWFTKFNGDNLIQHGQFTTYGSKTANFVNILKKEGTTWVQDTSSINIGTGLSSYNGYYNLPDPDDDGKWFLHNRVTGTTYSGSSIVRGTIRLNFDGTLDSTWNLGTGMQNQSNLTGWIRQSNGYVSSHNEPPGAVNGTAVGRVFKLGLSGSVDTTFNSNLPVSPNTNTGISTTDNDKVLLFNTHPSINFSTRNFWRLNADGTEDTAFSTNVGSTSLHFQSALTLSSGKIIVTTRETSGNWNATPIGGNVFRINADGTYDSTFNEITTNNGIGSWNQSSWVYDEGEGLIYIVGSFTTANSTTYNKFLVFDEDGNISSDFTDTQFNGTTVNGVTKYNNNVIVTGDFTQYKGDTSYQRTMILDRNANLVEETSLDPFPYSGTAKVYGTMDASSYSVNSTPGVSGVFNTTGSFNITVKNGIITAIV